MVPDLRVMSVVLHKLAQAEMKLKMFAVTQSRNERSQKCFTGCLAEMWPW